MVPLEVSVEPEEPLDPDYVRFHGVYTEGVLGDMVPIRDVSDSMGLSTISMGRKLSKWGYHTERKYLGGKRERVVMGIKVI